MTQRCEILNRTREAAKRKGLPTQQVLCEFLPVCDGGVCYKAMDIAAIVELHPSASSPSRTEMFMQRMEATITGRRPASTKAI